MIDLTNNSFLRQCTKIFVTDYTFIFRYFDIRSVQKRSSKSFRILTTEAARDYTTLRCVLSHVKHDFMVRLPKQTAARAYTSRKVSGSQYPRNLRPNTLRVSYTSFTSRLNDCGLFHVLIYRVSIAAESSKRERTFSTLRDETWNVKNSARVQKRDCVTVSVR